MGPKLYTDDPSPASSAIPDLSGIDDWLEAGAQLGPLSFFQGWTGPAYQYGLTGSNYYTNNNASDDPILPQYNSNFATYLEALWAHAAEKFGIVYHTVGSENRGYCPGGGCTENCSAGSCTFTDYIALYNAVWDQVKNSSIVLRSGPFAGQNFKDVVKLGGPYTVFPNFQPGQGGYDTDPGTDYAGRAIPPCNGTANAVCNWGAIYPPNLADYIQFRDQAHGLDFVAIDQYALNTNGSSSPNPDNLSNDCIAEVSHDTTAWTRANIAGPNTPIVAVESYGWFQDSIAYYQQRFGEGGGDLIFYWQDSSITGGGLFLDPNTGAIQPMGQALQTFLESHPPNNLLTP